MIDDFRIIPGMKAAAFRRIIRFLSKPLFYANFQHTFCTSISIK